MASGMADNSRFDNVSGRSACKFDLGELFRAAKPFLLNENRPNLADFHRQDAAQATSAPFSRRRAPRSLMMLRGSCGIRAAGVPGRGENGKTWRWVRPHSSTILSEFKNISSVSVGKPAMISAPNTTSGRILRTSSQNRMVSVAQMAALHPLQDHVVTGLQRQMEMRHQTVIVRDHLHQILIRLDGVDRGQAQPLEIRHHLQDLGCQGAELRLARQIRAIRRDVDAGQHDFVVAVVDQTFDLIDHNAHRHGPGIAAAIGDDAEGAAVIAAVLDLNKGTGPGQSNRRSGGRQFPRHS
jgi:hypothetical protein